MGTTNGMKLGFTKPEPNKEVEEKVINNNNSPVEGNGKDSSSQSANESEDLSLPYIDRRTVTIALVRNYSLYRKNGSDIIFVINNLVDIPYANAILAAQLSLDDFTEYPENVDYITYYDIDKLDQKNNSYAYHNYNHLTKSTSIDNLVNMRLYEDVYKNALIDTLIKSILRLLDFDKYKGRLYNAYIKLQIERSVKDTLDDLKGIYFKNYEIKNVGFVKTEDTAGYIYIELLIMPYGFMEYIDVVMEV